MWRIKFHTHTKQQAKFLESKPEHKRSSTEWQQAFPDFKMLLYLREWNFDLLGLFPNNNCYSLPNDLLSNFIFWFSHALWSQDMTIYFVFSAYTSRPISLLVITTASVFLLIVSEHLVFWPCLVGCFRIPKNSWGGSFYLFHLCPEKITMTFCDLMPAIHTSYTFMYHRDITWIWYHYLS